MCVHWAQAHMLCADPPPPGQTDWVCVSVQLGTTLDDAIGEAFDKVARMLGLELFPSGGASLEAFAREGDPHAFDFSIPLRHEKTCNFSFSGLKNNIRLAVEAEVGEDLSDATRQVRCIALWLNWGVFEMQLQ